MKVLLTGGAGFIGSHVADLLLARGHDVAIIDNFSTGKRENVPEGARFMSWTFVLGAPKSSRSSGRRLCVTKLPR